MGWIDDEQYLHSIYNLDMYFYGVLINIIILVFQMINIDLFNYINSK